MGTQLEIRKEVQILIIERDRLVDALRRLDEGRETGDVTKLDYDILHDRYEKKLRDVEEKLGLGQKKKSKRLASLKILRNKRNKGT
jgi:hypothetical protein